MEDRKKINDQLKQGIWGDEQHTIVLTISKDGEQVYSEINGNDLELITALVSSMYNDQRTRQLILTATELYNRYCLHKKSEN